MGATAVDCGEAVWRFSAGGVVPQCVVRPASEQGVASVVRAVRARGGALVPTGNGTHLGIGFPPRRYDVALCTQRLDRLVEHNAADMTVTVQPGLTLSALNAVLAGARQWLPFDPPQADRTTIGGLIAADRNGPLRLAYGKVRDFLIGIKVVLADGTVVKGGGRVVKNVAGYDLPKLFAGSFGTLGVIVEASFKVRPRPVEQRLFVWPAPTLGAAMRRASSLLDGSVFPSMLEAVNEPAAEAIGLAPGAALVIGCAGSRAEMDVQEQRLCDASEGGATRCDAARAAALLKALQDFPHPANEDALVARLSVVPSRLGTVLDRVQAEAAARRVVVEVAAHAGNGVAWCQVLGAREEEAVAWFAEWMRVYAREQDAWVIFEALPPKLRGRLDPWGFSEASLPLMAGVKRALDPSGVFSPGRFVGGI